LYLRFKLLDAIALQSWRCWNAFQVVARTSFAARRVRIAADVALDLQAMALLTSAKTFPHNAAF
jgi:hypothetical protein